MDVVEKRGGGGDVGEVVVDVGVMVDVDGGVGDEGVEGDGGEVGGGVGEGCEGMFWEKGGGGKVNEEKGLRGWVK